MTTEPTKTAEKNIWMPYDWSTGEATGTFLTGLREADIVASVCEDCGGKRIVPARSFCTECQTELSEFETVSETGTVTLYTVVRSEREAAPISPPYALALIRLDGADTDMLHFVKGDADSLEELAIGDQVQAVWKPADERDGSILDIDHFQREGPR